MTQSLLRRFFVVIALITIGSSSSLAQASSGLEQGIKPYGAYQGGDIDSVSMVNGNLTLHIPLISYPQRGNLHAGFSIVYQNPVLQPWAGCNDATYVCSAGGYNVVYGGGNFGPDPITIVADGLPKIIPVTTPAEGYTVIEPDGASHIMAQIAYGEWLSEDASGYMYIGVMNKPGVLYDREGRSYSFPNDALSSSVTDSNGNYMNINFANVLPTITDTLGRTLPQSNAATADYSGCPTGTVRAQLLTFPGIGGGSTAFKVCYATFPISFNLCGSTSYCSATVTTANLPQSIVLPSGALWTFGYDNYGSLNYIKLPTGGSISYVWTTTSGKCVGSNYVTDDGIVTGMAPYGRAVTSRTVNDGTGSYPWYYTLSTTTLFGPVTTTVKDPLNNYSIHTESVVVPNATCSLYETELDQYDSANNLIKKTATTYTGVKDPNHNYLAMNVVPQTITYTDMPSGQVNSISKTYDSGVPMTNDSAGGTPPNVIYGELLSQSDYSFGSGAPGSLLQTTTNTYMAFSGPNAGSYLQENMLSLPYTVTITDGSGNQVARTQYNYDESAKISSGLGSGSQTSSGYGTYVGNNTSVLRWLNNGTFTCPNGKSAGSGGYVTSTKTYFNTGQLYTSSDPCGNTTTLQYSSSYIGAYPTSVTNALGQTTTNTYDFNSGLLNSTTDQNGLTTSYSYDSLWRLSEVDRPDGGSDRISRQETSYPFSTTWTSSINSSVNRWEMNVFDGMGRVKQTQRGDPQGMDYVDRTYDALGRVHSVSNPYRTGSDATSSPQGSNTVYGYDGIGRKILETYPDNSFVTTAYCGPSTLVTDPAGRWRRSRIDALGHLVEVDEPNAIGASVSSCPGSSDPVWATSYTNDVLGNLTSVVQSGSRTRTFTFDSLSRMLSSTNPESGTISYVYNPDGTVASKTRPGPGSASFTTTNYTYDALHRVTGVTYSNGDPSLSYTYDGSNCLGLSACQNIGHRTGMTDASGYEMWAYQVDRSNFQNHHQEMRVNNSSPANVSKGTSYTLDLAGNVTQVLYPTGRVINYSYDSADRPATAADGESGASYVTGWQTPPSGTSCTSGGACYTPQASLAAMSIGQSCSASALNVQELYNIRMQPSEVTASSTTGGTLMDITYSYDPGTKHNAGHVNTITNRLNSGRTQTFGYDQVNRITSASTSATTGANCWGYQYGYDAWGNLTEQVGVSSAYSQCTEYTMAQVAPTSANQLPILTYDGAGNTLSDGINSYTWNAESQMTSSTNGGSTTGYGYDGDGRRVSKGGSKLYWYGSGGEILAETDTSGNLLNEYVYFGGRRIAQLPSSGTALYYAQDMLGSAKIITQSNGTLCYDADFTPFGSEQVVTNTCPQPYKFEGKERDTESGNDDFGARMYAWRFGRWLSADWSSVPVPVPYANLTNPQTLNLYSMVSDDPESFADLGGHYPVAGASGVSPSLNEPACDPLFNNSCLAASLQSVSAGGVQPEQWMQDQQGGTDDQKRKKKEGHGFWSRLGQQFANFFSGNGFKTNMQLMPVVTANIVPGSEREVREPNPVVTAVADTLSVAGAATGHPSLGYTGSVLSVANDRSSLNLVFVGGSFVPVMGESIGAVGIVYDVGDFAGHSITNNVMAPMINAIPGNTMGDGNGHSIPTPEAQCVASGMC